MWKKIQKFSLCRLQDISVWIDKNHFFGLAKNKAHLYEKMSMLVVLLWIHSSRQVGYMLEIFRSFENCTTYRKKILSRKSRE